MFNQILIIFIYLFFIILEAGSLIFFLAILYLSLPKRQRPLFFAPSSKKTVAKMLDLAQVQPSQILVDLGAGDGRILIAAAKRGLQAIGYEIDPFLSFLIKIKIKLSGLTKQIRILRQDFFQADLSKADIVTVYGVPKIMPAIERLCLAKLKPGSKVICHQFALPNLKAVKSNGKIFLYIF